MRGNRKMPDSGLSYSFSRCSWKGGTLKRNTTRPERASSATPYDDVYRTMMNDCSPLLIPVINEVFGEHFTGKDEIRFSPNEHFINEQDGREAKRITDSAFAIIGVKTKNTSWNIRVHRTTACWSGSFNMPHRLLWMKAIQSGTH